MFFENKMKTALLSDREPSVGSKSFGKTLFTANKTCISILGESYGSSIKTLFAHVDL